MAGIEGGSCPGWNQTREIESTTVPPKPGEPTGVHQERPSVHQSRDQEPAGPPNLRETIDTKETLVNQSSRSQASKSLEPPQPHNKLRILHMWYWEGFKD